MSYRSLDTFIDEVNVNNGVEIEPKGFELYDIQFDLIDELPAMAAMEYSRTINRDPVGAIATLLRVMLGADQYDVFSDLAIEHTLNVQQLLILIEHIFAMYMPLDTNPNDKKVQRGKRR